MASKEKTKSAIDDKTQQMIAQYGSHAESIEQQIEAFTIECDEDYAAAAQTLAEVKGFLARIVEKKELITVPLNKALTETRNLFRPTEGRLSGLEALIKRKMGAFVMAQETARRLAAQEAEKALNSGTAAEVSSAMVKLERAQVAPVSGTSARFTYDIKIVDPDLVPAEHWIIDEAALTKLVRAKQGKITIPGVEVIKRPIIASGAV